jgi:hypothetical protein
MKETALRYYLDKKGNCAQSVTYALVQNGFAPTEAIDTMRAFGGGRAPGRTCGALHAAVSFAPDPQQGQMLTEKFATASGGFTACPQVRAARKLTCAQCVETAAALADELYNKK